MSLQKNGFAARMFGGAMKFGAWLQSIPNRVTPPPFRLVQIGSAFWQSRALYVAARLDLATVIAERTLTVEEIATQVAADPEALYRLLRFLSALGIFAEAAPRRFANNRLSEPLREGSAQSVRAMILMHNSAEMSRPWYEQLEPAVRDGDVPFERTHGAGLFDYMDTHAGFDALFTRAMESVEALGGDAFATDFDWGRFERVIDVGGSNGSKALAILRHHPRLRALVVDRAQAIAGGVARWRGAVPEAVLSRLEFRAGDLFGALPAARNGRDIYLLSAVLHGFSDEECIRALRNIADARGDSGAPVAILELVLPDAGADLAGAAFDMQMFMGTRGRERTLAQWSTLAGTAGLRIAEVVALRSFPKIIVLDG